MSDIGVGGSFGLPGAGFDVTNPAGAPGTPPAADPAGVPAPVTRGGSPARPDPATMFPSQPVQPPKTKWEGPMAKPIALSPFGYNQEKKVMAAHGGKALVLPYGRKPEDFDPSKPPVLLVHGYGPALLMRDLADRMEKEGYQVFVAFYDNENVQPHESGKQIADQLAKLRAEYYPEGQPFDVIGHSMGGLVARCALNYLAEPGWLEDAPEGVDWPEDGGFGKVRLRTVDTAIDGYSWDNETPALLKVMDEAKTDSEDDIDDMFVASKMYENLYSVPLDSVDFQNIVAYNKQGKEDWVRSLLELKPSLACEVCRCLRDGTEPENLQLRNLTRGLRADSRGEALRAELVRAEQQGRLELDAFPTGEFMPALAKVFDKVMPRVEGRHIWLLTDKRFREDDAVDRLVQSLAQPR